MASFAEENPFEYFLIVLVLLFVFCIISMLVAWLGGRKAAEKIMNGSFDSSFIHLPFPFDLMLILLAGVGILCWHLFPHSTIAQRYSRGWNKQLFERYKDLRSTKRKKKQDRKKSRRK